jgi:hypothetical protein
MLGGGGVSEMLFLAMRFELGQDLCASNSSFERTR